MGKIKDATCENTYTCKPFVDEFFILHACDGCSKVILPQLVTPHGSVKIYNRTDIDIIIENPTYSTNNTLFKTFLKPKQCITFKSSMYRDPLPEWKFMDVVDTSRW